MARKTEKGGKFRNIQCRTWNRTGRRKRLVRVLEDCTRRQAEDRFPNMEEVMGALRPLMEKEDKNRDKNKGGSRIGLLCRKSVYEPCVFCRKEWGTGL